MSGFYDVSSDMVGNGETSYGIAYAPKLRRQWMLTASMPGISWVAAYFRSEAEARCFADTFGLTITDHRREAQP